MTAVVVKILLGVSGFNMARGGELTVVNTDIDVQKSDVGGGRVAGEVERIVTVKPFKESSEGVRSMGPE